MDRWDVRIKLGYEDTDRPDIPQRVSVLVLYVGYCALHLFQSRRSTSELVADFGLENNIHALN